MRKNYTKTTCEFVFQENRFYKEFLKRYDY